MADSAHLKSEVLKRDEKKMSLYLQLVVRAISTATKKLDCAYTAMIVEGCLMNDLQRYTEMG